MSSSHSPGDGGGCGSDTQEPDRCWISRRFACIFRESLALKKMVFKYPHLKPLNVYIR